MTIFSRLRPLFRLSTQPLKNAVVERPMSDHKVFPLTPTRWQWNKTKDLFHYYVLLGVIPCSLVVLYANVFVGPATLSEIPEDHVPKYWEYERHPISRWLARYIFNSPQQDYEKFLNYLFIEEEKRKLRELETNIRKKISERNDYQAYYYRPVIAAKYYRANREAADYLESIRGD